MIKVVKSIYNFFKTIIDAVDAVIDFVKEAGETISELLNTCAEVIPTPIFAILSVGVITIIAIAVLELLT
jgi:phage-related minor tail protein